MIYVFKPDQIANFSVFGSRSNTDNFDLHNGNTWMHHYRILRQKVSGAQLTTDIAMMTVISDEVSDKFEVRRNGVSEYNSNENFTFRNHVKVLGGESNAKLHGHFCEAMFFNETDYESIIEAEMYLAEKWGVSYPIPTPTPSPSPSITPIPFSNNKSLEFSQNTDFVSFGDTHDNGNNTFQFGTSAFSISVWVKPSKLVANNQIFGAHGGSGWTICSLNDGIFTFFAGGFGSFTGGSLTTGVWQHLVVTRDGTVFNMYLNKSKTSHTVSVSNVNTASIFYTRLGWDGGSLPSIRGLIDEAAVWNVALTDADVTALYDNGPNDLNAEESYDTNRSNNLVAWYRNGDTEGDVSGATKITNAATGSASAGSIVDGTISGSSFVNDVPT